MRFTIKEPIYGTAITFMVCKTFAPYAKAVHKATGEELESMEPGDAEGCNFTSRKRSFIWFPHLPDVPDLDTIDTFYHELGHACLDMLGHMGVDPTQEQETFLYLQGHYFRKAFGRIYKPE